MAIFARLIHVILFAFVTHLSAYADQTFSIELAVQAALERDALIRVYRSHGDAYRAQAISVDTLPDPKIKLGGAK